MPLQTLPIDLPNDVKELSLVEEYQKLNEQCDAIINKIKNRKEKLILENNDGQQK
jgi:hypothetical protein